MSTSAWARNGQGGSQQAAPVTQPPVILPFNTQEVRECLKTGYVMILAAS